MGAAAEVAQLYLAIEEHAPTRPGHELRDFRKVHLAPGETQHVELSVVARAGQTLAVDPVLSGALTELPGPGHFRGTGGDVGEA